MSSPEDLYIILEVGRKATVDDIKRAFRRLARRFHPDVNPGDRGAEERFKRISDAYDVLSDPSKREFYDLNGFYADGGGESGSAKVQWGMSFQGFNFFRPGSSAFSGLFGEFASRRSPVRGPERGQDVEYPLSVSFADSIRGMKTRISVYRKGACAACEGVGRLTRGREEPCLTCGGAGRMGRSKGHLQFVVPCSDCGGAGRLAPSCQACGGDGRVPLTDIMDIEIPAGVGVGSRVRIEGKGDAGKMGGAAGDLYVVTNVATDPFFERAGDNIYCTVPIAFWEAALGAKIEVPTMDGRTVIRIPPGTQNGQTFRMRGKGAPSLRQPGSRGDQFVGVRIVVPKIADERSREILKELARLNPEDVRAGFEGPDKKEVR